MMKQLILTAAIALSFTQFASAQRRGNPQVQALQQITDSTVLQKRLDSLKAGAKEEEVAIVAQYYYASNKMAEAEKVVELIKQRFPQGNYAYNAALTKLMTTKGGAKKEEMYKSIQQQFPDRKSQSTNMYSLAYGFIEEGDTTRAKPYVDRMPLTGSFITYWFSLSSAATNAGRPVFAEQLMRKAINVFDTLKLKPEPQGDPMGLANNRDKYAAMYYSGYATLLSQNGKKAEALTYAAKAYEVGKDNAEVAASYALLLVDNKDYAAAIPLLEGAVKKGMSNQATRESLRKAYTAVKGAKGWDTYIASLTQALRQEVLDSVKKQLISEPSPMFTLRDVNGKSWSMEQLKGKVVVLDFWATWCAPCKRSFPAMQMAVNKFQKDPNVVFLFIHTWERVQNPTEDAKDYVTQNKYNFNVLMDLKEDGKNKVVSSYNVRGIPAKFVIDGKGNIRFKLTGFSGGDDAAVEELSAMIDMAKKG